jgi:hypothetical protein
MLAVLPGRAHRRGNISPGSDRFLRSLRRNADENRACENGPTTPPCAEPRFQPAAAIARTTPSREKTPTSRFESFCGSPRLKRIIIIAPHAAFFQPPREISPPRSGLLTGCAVPDAIARRGSKILWFLEPFPCLIFAHGGQARHSGPSP